MNLDEQIAFAPEHWPLIGLILFVLLVWLTGRYVSLRTKPWVLGFGFAFCFAPIPIPYIGIAWAGLGILRGMFLIRSIDMLIGELLMLAYISILGLLASIVIKIAMHDCSWRRVK